MTVNRTTRIVSLTVLFIILMTGFTGFAQNRYVSPQGNNTNAGTLTSPWKTIQYAAQNALPGDTVQIMAGTYNERVIPFVTGLPSAYITFKNYQTDFVTINGAGSSGYGVFTFYGPAYLQLMGIHFAISDSTQYNYQPAIVISSTSHHIQINNCKIDGMWNLNGAGIAIYGSDTLAGNHDITIAGCTIGSQNIWHMGTGIYLSGNVYNVTLKNNEIFHQRDNGIALVGSDSTCVKGNLDVARNITVQNNSIHDIFNPANPGQYKSGIIVSGARACSINANRIFNCDFGFNLAAYSDSARTRLISFTNNMVYENNQQGLAMGVFNYNMAFGRVNNCQVANNTFYHNDLLLNNGGEVLFTPMDSCKVVHNIFFANQQGRIVSSILFNLSFPANVIDYNIHGSDVANPALVQYYWDGTTATGFGMYKALSGYDTHTIFSDPLFVDRYNTSPDLHLYNNSAAINSGSASYNALAGSTDYFGTTRVYGGMIDIGACENQGDYFDPVYNGIKSSVGTLVKVSPNPAHDYLDIEGISPSSKISCVDLVGRRYLLTSESQTDGLVRINVSQLCSGLFYLKIEQQGNSLSTISFVKN